MGETEKEGIVRKGHNKRAEEYHASKHAYDNRKEMEKLANSLPKNGKVLDACCGAGVPVAEFLIKSGFDRARVLEPLQP